MAEQEPSVEDRIAATLTDDLLYDSYEEVPASAPAPEPQPRDTEEEVVEQPAEEKVEDKAEEPVEEAAEEDEGEVELPGSIGELAEALGVELDDLTAMKHTVRASGEDLEVSVADLVAGFQLKTDYDKGRSALTQEREALEHEYKERVEAYNRDAAVLAESLSLSEKALMTDVESPEFQRLREVDPAAWSAAIVESNQRVAQIQQARTNAGEQFDTYMANARQQKLEAERQKLVVDVPGWGEDKLEASVEALKSVGYDDAAIADAADANLVKAGLEIARLQAEVKTLSQRVEKGVKAVKQVKRLPSKSIKPGAGKRVDARTSKVTDLRRHLRKTGDHKTAATLIEASLPDSIFADD